MRAVLGIDTSNYTTSLALYAAGEVTQQKRLLPVAPGQLGLRQSDAVFAHVKALGELAEALFSDGMPAELCAVGVSSKPRPAEGSYMPCFMAGVMAAKTLSAAMGLPLFEFSHQGGHIAAAVCGAGRPELMTERFIAFHLSGGTTECVLVEELPDQKFTLLSCTNDLNAGQVVDRVGKLLGLDFPAGLALDALARRSDKRYGVKATFRQGNPCLSGVENQCAAMVKRGEESCDVARFCLDSILAALLKMADNAVEATGCKTLLFAGGVMSNSIIRPAVEEAIGGIFAPAAFSCDNAAGIAALTAYAAGEWKGCC